MARAIWKGSIAFGLVNIPVSLVSADRRPDIQLHMVDSKNHSRIRYERVNADTGEEVPWDRMIKAYEHDDGRFILLGDEELAGLKPELTKTIQISEFVNLDEIDPLLFDKPYYLEPDTRGKKAYVLLREALRNTNKAGISRVVIRTREYLSAMFVRDEVLVLMLLRFPQELMNHAKLELPAADDAKLKPAKKEMQLAEKLIAEMTETWKPDDFHDEYREALMNYIDNKIETGETVEDVKEGEKKESGGGTKVVDLADYLERSVKQKAGGSKKKTAKKGTRKNAKKTTRKKARSA